MTSILQTDSTLIAAIHINILGHSLTYHKLASSVLGQPHVHVRVVSALLSEYGYS